jgi:uncharacterized protein YndB with AHSA1/START domain
MNAIERRNEPATKNPTTVERKSERVLVVTRMFNGPARIVFDAVTKPELLKRWWAPKSRGVVLFGCEAEIRVGGSYRYVFGRDADNPMVFSGIYKEVTPYSRLVCTQVFEQMRQAGEVIITVTLDEHDGKTQLVSHQLYPSKEALDGAIASGMESGMRESYEQLEQLVTDMR